MWLYQFFFKFVEVTFETLALQHFSIAYSGFSSSETEALLAVGDYVPENQSKGLGIVDAHLIVLASNIAYLATSEIFDGIANVIYVLVKG